MRLLAAYAVHVCCHLAQMSWMECQDGGDPAVAVSPRDVVYVLGENAWVPVIAGQVVSDAASQPLHAS